MYSLKNVTTFSVTVMVEEKGKRKPVILKPQKTVKTDVLTDGLKGLIKKNILVVEEIPVKKEKISKE